MLFIFVQLWTPVNLMHTPLIHMTNQQQISLVNDGIALTDVESQNGDIQM